MRLGEVKIGWNSLDDLWQNLAWLGEVGELVLGTL